MTPQKGGEDWKRLTATDASAASIRNKITKGLRKDNSLRCFPGQMGRKPDS